MRAIILALAIASLPVAATPIERDSWIETSERHAVVAAKLVRAHGYRCDSISTLRGAWGGGYVLFCNSFSYKCHIKDVGGTWRVSVV